MRLSSEGQRLDDSPLQRVYLRLGKVGTVVLLVGLTGGILRLLNRRRRGWQFAMMVLGFVGAIVMLCSEL